MKTRIRLLCVAMCLLPHAISAAPHSASGIILTYDMDGDQALSMEEFVEARRARFSATDTNSDGVIDEDEYVYEWEGRMKTRFSKDRKASVKQTHVRFNAIDKDDDGFILPEELSAIGQRGFDFMDQNEDGVILASDPEPERRSSRQSDDKKEDKITLLQRPLLRMPTTHSIKGFMDLYDTNGDETVTQEEFQAVRNEHFTRSDENGDGKLTEQEYVLEFEDRLDKQIEKMYKAQVKQAYVRFGVLDKNENKAMTFSEYMLSGMRSFSRHDTNEDGYLTVADPIRERPFDADDSNQEDKAKEENKESNVVAKVGN